MTMATESFSLGYLFTLNYGLSLCVAPSVTPSASDSPARCYDLQYTCHATKAHHLLPQVLHQLMPTPVDQTT